ncbi:hypothetical protein FD15_GL000226 [Liquorilactobacillus sucicola DSM 21376 = JCM 15457]|uniref:Uncharacterized protein n=2 Tax=Liquorilactobacillus sucicola TaxID=519050 RepID=A0A0R2DRM3_9LACO|nr:hypothetical protein FD15_GL000226 [Liquorilactobacillus sucicola DSM 21376 = JCM 15457]
MFLVCLTAWWITDFSIFKVADLNQTITLSTKTIVVVATSSQFETGIVLIFQNYIKNEIQDWSCFFLIVSGALFVPFGFWNPQTPLILYGSLGCMAGLASILIRGLKR